MRVLSVDKLEIEQIPKGHQTRLRVELVRDGLGNPVEVPVVIARGERDGPVFGVTAAVHGNELNGIPAIHRLLERLDLRKLRGTIVAVIVVNVPGFLQHQRGFADGTDLNHIMPGKADGNVAQIYGHRLVERIIGQFQYLVDLHTASIGRINSLYVRADMTDQATAQMAYLQRPQIILHDPPSDKTLRGAAMEHGIPAITVEVRDPQRFQKETIKDAVVGLRRVLAEVGMIARRPVALGPPPILCERSQWLFTDNGGLLDVSPHVTDMVAQGQVIARLSNIFGDFVREYHAPQAGVVIGKSVDPVAQTGARILHLGTLASAEKQKLFHPRANQIQDPTTAVEESP